MWHKVGRSGAPWGPVERQWDMFVGTFEHSLDDKGRVVLPVTFRAQISATKGILSQLDQCLGLWTADGFDEIARQLKTEIREGRAEQGAVRAFAASASEVNPDSQGRITIPQRQREFAGLERDAVLIGAIDRIEIWNADRWNDQVDAADDSLVKAVTALGL